MSLSPLFAAASPFTGISVKNKGELIIDTHAGASAGKQSKALHGTPLRGCYAYEIELACSAEFLTVPLAPSRCALRGPDGRGQLWVRRSV